MAMLAKHFQQAEAILVDQGELDQALAMYQTLHKFDDSIRLAERKNHPQVHARLSALPETVEPGADDIESGNAPMAGPNFA